MFQGFLAALAYVVLNLMISPLTALWLYASLRKNKTVSKKAYVVCAVLDLPLLVFWAIHSTDSVVPRQRPPVYIIFGLIGLFVLLSAIFFRSNRFFAAIQALMMGGFQCSIIAPLDLLSDFLKWDFSELTIAVIGFHIAMLLGVLMFFLSYLPRRGNARLDRAAVIVSVFSMAFILGDVVLNFVRPLHGTPMLVSDIAVCTLTAASYLLLLFAGKSAAPQPQPESEGNGQQPESEGNDPENPESQTQA